MKVVESARSTAVFHLEYFLTFSPPGYLSGKCSKNLRAKETAESYPEATTVGARETYRKSVFQERRGSENVYEIEDGLSILSRKKGGQERGEAVR